MLLCFGFKPKPCPQLMTLPPTGPNVLCCLRVLSPLRAICHAGEVPTVHPNWRQWLATPGTAAMCTLHPATEVTANLLK